VTILHDDDSWGSRFLERRVDFLDRNPECGFVFSDAAIIDAHGRELGRTPPRLPAGLHPSKVVLERLFRENIITVPTVLARRSVYEAIDAVYGEFLFNDHEMWLRLAAHSPVGVLHTCDANYRIHSGQTSSQYRLRLGEARLELLDRVADVPVSAKVRRAARVDAHVRRALDEAESGARRSAVHQLALAARISPVSLLAPRVAARIGLTLLVTAIGARGMRALARARERRWQAGGVRPKRPRSSSGRDDVYRERFG
jgi:hypothetical protein